MTTLEQKLKHQFADQNLLQRSLTHKSFYNELEDKSQGHNEKLEFLGDVVIDLSLSQHLYLEHPDFDEGDLSKLRASLVNESSLAELARELELQSILKLGKGEEKSGGRDKPRLLASVFEALIGAYFLDAGFEKVNSFVLEIFKSALSHVGKVEHFQTDYKTRLQEKTQELFKTTPDYELLAQDGPDHKKTFKVCVCVEGKTLAEGAGKSKKAAEQEAARLALEKLP